MVSCPLELSLQSSFNFPLWYLLTIGLVLVFSLRWGLPPDLGCIPKQPNSGKTQAQCTGGHYWVTPSMGWASIRRTWAPHEWCLGVGLLSATCPVPYHGVGIQCRVLTCSLAFIEGIWVSFFTSITNIYIIQWVAMFDMRSSLGGVVCMCMG